MRRLPALCWLIAVAGVASPLHPAAHGRAMQDPVPRFKSGVDVVEVAVLVRDRDGKPITDLRREEITVLERVVPFEVVGR